MREYKYSTETVNKMLRNITIFPYAIIQIFIIIVIFIFLVYKGVSISLGFIILMILVVILWSLVVFAGIYIGARLKRSILSSFRITLTDESIKRYQTGLVDMQIQFNEISKIIELPNKGIDVLALSPKRWIGISSKIENYSEIREELLKVHCIEPVSDSIVKWLPLLLIVVIIIPLFESLIILFSTSKLLILSAIILLFLELGIVIFRLQRSKYVITTLKVLLWINVVLIIVSFLIIIYYFAI